VPLIFTLSERIEGLYERNEFELVIIYGGLGLGKTSLASQVVAELYGDQDADPEDPDHWNWDAVKHRLMFHPRVVLQRIYELADSPRRERALIWDDAGVHAFSQDWARPFVKQVSRWVQTSRTDMACLIMTAPTPTAIVKRIRELPQAITAKVMRLQMDYLKAEGSLGGPRPPDAELVWRKPRLAKYYQMWRTPDMSKTGVREIARDQFDAMLPDHFYEWYEPIRKQYTRSILEEMQKALDSDGPRGPPPEEAHRAGEAGEAGEATEASETRETREAGEA
jgi:hypothetical protein